MAYFHQSVLLKEVIEYLNPSAGDNFIDCTVGGGGHTLALLEKIGPQGRVLAIDLDPKAIKYIKEKAKEIGVFERLILAEDNFANLKQIIEYYNFKPVRGLLLDLGLSSKQLADEERGFSFKSEGPLDMRFGKTEITAYEIINSWSKDRLAEIFIKYGEEPRGQKIAQEIFEKRRKESIKSARELAELVLKIKPNFRRQKIHPATQVFQALRIAVNEELLNLEKVLPQTIEVLAPGGRVAVISFHSLEDRIVKRFFRDKSRKDQPIIRLINKKVIKPTFLEIKNNPRARSAKLRVAERI